jgi:hypothetical protein
MNLSRALFPTLQPAFTQMPDPTTSTLSCSQELSHCIVIQDRPRNRMVCLKPLSSRPTIKLVIMSVAKSKGLPFLFRFSTPEEGTQGALTAKTRIVPPRS